MRIADSTLEDRVVMEVGKFAVLWNKFERYYFNTQYSRTKLNLNLPRIMGRFNENNIAALNNAVTQRMQNLYLNGFGNGQTDYYVRNKLGVRKALWDKHIQENDIELVKSFIDQDVALQNEDKMKAAIIICYRIRCNMFHGIKDTKEADIRGLGAQTELFVAVNNLLEILVR